MIKDHSQYLLNTYARPPLLFTKGQGCKLYATSPTHGSTSSTSAPPVEYLDFTGGIAVNALGHGDAEIAQLMSEQAGQLSHSSNVCWNEWAGELAKLLVEQTRTHGGLGLLKDSARGQGAKVFFSNSGTEANEGALKFARLSGKLAVDPEMTGKPDLPEKSTIVCFQNGFHGRSMGALSVTPNPKYQAPFAPLIPNVRVGQLNDYAALDSLVDESTCGVIIEPIQGEGGLNEGQRDWFVALANRARQVGAVLMYDEIQVRLSPFIQVVFTCCR